MSSIFSATVRLTYRARFHVPSGHDRDDVDAMQNAWRKSVLLQMTLWSHPYVTERDY
jgi:hypothetical protein